MTDFYYDLDGKRFPFKAPEYLPREGDCVLLTLYGRVRASRCVVTRVEWSVAQEESPAYFNRPKAVTVFLSGDASAKEGDPKGG